MQRTLITEYLLPTIQVFAVFDYYGNSDVQAKHKRAYDGVKRVLAQYEATDPRFNNQQLQKAWKEYCTAQAYSMELWAARWVIEKLGTQRSIWALHLGNMKRIAQPAAQYHAQVTLDSIGEFLRKLSNGHFAIDTSIYT